MNSRPTRQRARWILAITAMALIAGAVVLWRFTPLADLATPERLAEWVTQFRGKAWAPFAMTGLFVVGGLVMFPLILLIGGTAVLLDPLIALIVSLVGGLASALATYAVGARLLRQTAHSAFGPTVKKIEASLATRGVIAIAIIRMVPIAPFTLVNVAAGSIGVNLRDYAIGTVLGIAPGVIAITALGGQLRAVIEQPTVLRVTVLILIIAAWIGLSLLLQRLVARRRVAP